MDKLKNSVLAERIVTFRKPVLGSCVGMQLLTSYSEEGDADLLGIVPLKTLHFDKRIDEKVPHMGWNSVSRLNECVHFQGIADNSYFYFGHSYFLESDDPYTIARWNYGINFTSSIQKYNFFGVLFHPEKSL